MSQYLWCSTKTDGSVAKHLSQYPPLMDCIFLYPAVSFKSQNPPFSTQGHTVVVGGERMAGTEFSLCRWKLSVCHSASVLQSHRGDFWLKSEVDWNLIPMALVMSMDNSNLNLCFKKSEVLNPDLSRFKFSVDGFNVQEFFVNFLCIPFLSYNRTGF